MSASDRRPGTGPAGVRDGDPGAAEPIPDEPDPVERAAPDLRLAPLVLALWMGEAVTLLTGSAHPARWVLAGALVVVAALLGMGASRCRPAQPAAVPAMRTGLARVTLGGTRRQRTAMLIGLCGLGLGIALAGAHLLRLHPPVLQAAA